MLAGPASAATGDQHVVILGQDDGGTVVATGPISGVGQDVVTGEETDQFASGQGSVTVNHHDTSGNQDFSDVTCVARFSVAGNCSIGGGTGAYAGATGTGTYTVRGLFVGPAVPPRAAATRAGRAFYILDATGTTTLP